MRMDDMILRFFRDDVGGILIVDAGGGILYADDRASEIINRSALWKRVCPPPAEGQRGEVWDLPNGAGGQPYMVTTSTFIEGGDMFQVHHFTDSSVYMALFRDMNDYSRALKDEKEHDGLTGLYNKGKLMELKQSLFRNQDNLAVFNFDVNNLKRMNDTYGHEAGDRLICKAAESLRRIEARNVLTFRTGGDEFVAVALHISAEDAEALRRRWAEGLAQLNQARDGVNCEIACGLAHGTKGYDMEELFALADQRMYDAKLAMKRAAQARPEGGASE